MLDNFLNQLRANPRLRWGIALLIGIVWLYALLLLRENLQEQTQQHGAAAQGITRLRAQLAQPEWAARVTPAKMLAVQLEGRLWQAPTSGLAQAAFQDWLNAAMLKAGVTNPQISVTVLDEALTTAPTDLWKIKAKLAFNFSAANPMDFLSRIESHEKQIIVGSLNVRKEPLPFMEMELFGYFQKQAAPAAKAAPPVVPL